MSFRDDGDAMLARMAALEHEATRADELAVRVQQLEQTNRELLATIAQLRAQLPDVGTQTPTPDYIARMLDEADRARARAREQLRRRMPPPPPFVRHPLTHADRRRYIGGVLAAIAHVELGGDQLETALPIEAAHLADAASAHARDAGYDDIAHEDLDAATRDVLTSRLIVRPDATLSIEAIVEQILTWVAKQL